MAAWKRHSSFMGRNLAENKYDYQIVFFWNILITENKIFSTSQ